MKKPIFLFIAFIIFLFSCRKFENGGKTHKSESTISQAWILESYAVNGIDSTKAKMDIGFDSTLITFYQGENTISRYTRYRHGYTVGPIRNPEMTGNKTGQYASWGYEDYWEIDEKNRNLKLLEFNFFESWKSEDYYFKGIKGDTIQLASTLKEFKILKLTSEQLWLEGDLNSNHFDIHFRKFN